MIPVSTGFPELLLLYISVRGCRVALRPSSSGLKDFYSTFLMFLWAGFFHWTGASLLVSLLLCGVLFYFSKRTFCQEAEGREEEEEGFVSGGTVFVLQAAGLSARMACV